MDTYATATATLTPERWWEAGRRMVAKLLAELSYEQVVEPVETASGYAVELGAARWTFAAEPRLWERLRVEPGSVRRDGEPAVDPVRLLLDLREVAGVDAPTAAHLLKEISATLVADAHAAAGPRRGAAELLDLDYAELEGELTGHPWIAANKGRLGFGYGDYLRFAPERRAPQQLRWLAARASRASYQAVAGLDRERLLAVELDASTRDAFAAVLRRRGADPGAYHWFPVHDWQWEHVVLPLFAADLAAGDLVVLGLAGDRYLPQQSIRTLSNLSNPERHHVKLPLSILNTLVYRGLPTERTVAAPRVSELLLGLRDRDPFLARECRPVLLGEVASVAVPHAAFESLPGCPYQYQELLGCIWREPLGRFLEPGERAVALAALLHTGADGVPVVSALVERSGMAPRQWLARLFATILPPLLHFLYRYGVAFSPHGENALLLHRDGVPARLGVKDFVDDVNLSEARHPELDGALPPALASVLLTEPPEWLCQFLQAGLFVGHLRYLADLVEDSLGVPERDFWRLLRDTILDYQARFPALADRYRRYDLLAPDLVRICLNRNRLLLDGYADRAERPHAATFGRVRNALYEVASEPAPSPR